MSFPCYSSYKDSGVDWLGEIPSHWGCEPLKYSTEIYTGNSLNDTEKQQYESIDESDIPYVSSKDLDLQTRTINYENGLRVPVESNKLKVAPKNSFLLCIEGGSAGKKIALLKQDVCFVNKLCCFKDRNDARFKYFLAQSKNFKDKFELSMTGLIGGVSTSALKNFSTPVPSDEERDSIVNFLEYETSKIDTLIAEQIKLIELLKEKRQAVISSAVTKGLDSSKKMKDSGVEWLGEIPEHWDIKPLFSLVKECNYKNKGMTENNLLSLSYGEIVKKDINSNDGLLPESFETYQIVEPDDIVMRLTDLQNDKKSLRSAIVKERGIITSAYLAIRSTKIDPDYLNYLLRVYDLMKVFYSMGGGLRQSMKFDDLKRMSLIIPPLEQQNLIVNYLDALTVKFRELINKSERTIELLRERRSALISAAVTGQIDVRNFVYKEAA